MEMKSIRKHLRGSGGELRITSRFISRPAGSTPTPEQSALLACEHSLDTLSTGKDHHAEGDIETTTSTTLMVEARLRQLDIDDEGGAGRLAIGPTSDEDKSNLAKYISLRIHEEMMRDGVCTLAYARALSSTAETATVPVDGAVASSGEASGVSVCAGKVVLDVGCGTGILSMLAARAGARRVVGVDVAEVIDAARAVVRDNGFADVVTLHKGKCEEMDLVRVLRLSSGEDDKKEEDVASEDEGQVVGGCVDVIVSEWMGYTLLFGNLLASVIHARDTWLVEGGVMLPRTAGLFVALCDHGGLSTRECYGFDMSAVYSWHRRCMDTEEADVDALVVDVRPDSVMSESCCVKSIDCMWVRYEDLDFTETVRLEAKEDGVVDSVVFHFECGFGGDVVLSTAPTDDAGLATHWKQTVLLLPGLITVESGDVVEVETTFKRLVANQRHYAITLNVKHERTETRFERVYL